MTEREFRAKVKAAFPGVKISVRTVSFMDLARASRKCLTIGEASVETCVTINGWAQEAGIIPDGSARFSEEG